jgi:type II secretion system protein H
MGRARQHRGGFTLIEMMAVVTIFALLAAFVAPQIGAVSGRYLRQTADDIGTQLQFARERSVLTGAPHRLLFDLDDDGYRVEWWVSDARAAGQSTKLADERAGDIDRVAGAAIAMAAPRRAERQWHPLIGRPGKFAWVQEGVFIAGVETAGEWIERGDVGIVFDPDGTTAPAAVLLDDESERRLRLSVLPLADGVRIENEE